MMLLAFFAAALWGCQESSPSPAPRDTALKDPMNYNPADDRYDISGGGLLELDKKAMRKDLNSVFNP